MYTTTYKDVCLMLLKDWLFCAKFSLVVKQQLCTGCVLVPNAETAAQFSYVASYIFEINYFYIFLGALDNVLFYLFLSY